MQFSKAGDVGRRSVFFSSEKLASSDPRLQSAQNGSVISVPVFVNTTRIFLRYGSTKIIGVSTYHFLLQTIFFLISKGYV